MRVDIRGSGDSEGVLQGEYLATELNDAVEVIDWIAAQPWCNGRVGMMGISWGGFNSLQVAALRPPALGAVVSVAATADRYAVDVHYKGGCLLAGDMLPWATTMSCFNARPPTRRTVGDAWRRQWIERVNSTPFFVHDWLAHQRRDDFWKHGSVGEDYSAIECPVLIVGGLADGYTDTVFHVAEGLSATGEVPWRGIVGPWSHNYPAVGVPGPNIGFLQEVVNWFALHLDDSTEPGTDGSGRDADRGVVVTAADSAEWTDPMRIWLQRRVAPAEFHPERPGRWISEPTWPSPRITHRELWLSPAHDGADDDLSRQHGVLSRMPSEPAMVSGTNSQTCGLRQGSWWGYAQPGQLPADQRLEEPAAFRFLTEPAGEALSIVGIPRLRLLVGADADRALVAVRLCDVAPDGSSLQLSRGVLNLCHRTGHGSPAAVGGGPMAVEVVLDGVAHELPPGHRLELHIGTALWPLIWPSPTPVTLTLHLGPDCSLLLPVRSGDVVDAVHPFGQPETADPGAESLPASPPVHARTITEDTGTGTVTLIDHADSGEIRFAETGDVLRSTATDTWIINRHDPLSARVVCHRTWSIRWTDHPQVCRAEAVAEMWCDGQAFHTTNTVTIHEGETELARRSDDRLHRRDHL
jgi:predicted acyl esterase